MKNLAISKDAGQAGQAGAIVISTLESRPEVP